MSQPAASLIPARYRPTDAGLCHTQTLGGFAETFCVSNRGKDDQAANQWAINVIHRQ